jgi:hypothetical protein
MRSSGTFSRSRLVYYAFPPLTSEELEQGKNLRHNKSRIIIMHPPFARFRVSWKELPVLEVFPH